MAQEFVIKSPDIEDKINQLLPSQGGFQAGVDFSASTMVVPIIDLTETAEGSNVRPDLQSALSLNSITSFLVQSATTTIINTTGYFRIFGYFANNSSNSATIRLTDGTTTKNILDFTKSGGAGTVLNPPTEMYDFIVYLKAGESVQIVSSDANQIFSGNTRQIADINGNLVDP